MLMNNDHKKSLLVGNGSDDTEEKTQAQLLDEMRPDSMRESSKLFNDAEIDETPAIERVTNHKTSSVALESHFHETKMEIDSSFADEMHARQEAERKAREEEKKKAERAAKEAEEQKQKSGKTAPTPVAKELLSSEDSRKIEKEKLYQENLQRLYPEKAKQFTDEEDKIWKAQQEKGEEHIRASIEESINPTFAFKLNLSISSQAIAIAAGVITYFLSANGLIIQPVFALLSLVPIFGMTIGLAILFPAIKKYAKNEVQAGLQQKYLSATLPIYTLMTVIFMVVGAGAMALFQEVGKYIGYFMGYIISYLIISMLLRVKNIQVGLLYGLASSAAIAIGMITMTHNVVDAVILAPASFVTYFVLKKIIEN